MNQITDSTIRKMHERSGKLVNRIQTVDMKRQIVSADYNNDADSTPHQFNKNVLTREQLNELLDMKEVKKIMKARRRSNQPSTIGLKSFNIKNGGKRTQSNIRGANIRDQKTLLNAQIMATGSGLVLESNSIPKAKDRNFIKVRTYKNNRNNVANMLMTEASIDAKRDSIFKNELDVDSEMSIMQSEQVNAAFLPHTSERGKERN